MSTLWLLPCHFNDFLDEVDETQCLFWYMWQPAHTRTSQKRDFGEWGSRKDKCFVRYQRKSFVSFLIKSWFCPVLACVATCIYVQTKINQPAQLDQLKGIRSSMTRIVSLSFLLFLLSSYHQTWHNSSLRENLSKAEKVKFIMTSLWRPWCHLCSDEYQKLLTMVYIRAGVASSTFIWSYSNLAETFSTSTAFDWQYWIWINRCFSCSDDVINIILAFWQMIQYSPWFFSYLLKICFFWHRLWKSMP